MFFYYITNSHRVISETTKGCSLPSGIRPFVSMARDFAIISCIFFVSYFTNISMMILTIKRNTVMLKRIIINWLRCIISFSITLWSFMSLIINGPGRLNITIKNRPLIALAISPLYFSVILFLNIIINMNSENNKVKQLHSSTLLILLLSIKIYLIHKSHCTDKRRIIIISMKQRIIFCT